MAMSPIPVGSSILVEPNDENDPAGTFNAYLVDGNDESYTEIACSQYSDETPLENQKQFLWAMSSLATFHGLGFQNDTGVTVP